MTFTNNIIRNLTLAVAAVLFAAVLVAVAPSVKAADLDLGGYDYFGGDYAYDAVDYFGGDYGYDTYDYYGGDYGYDTYGNDAYDYSSYDQSYDYSSYDQAYQDYYDQYYEEYYADTSYSTPSCASCSAPYYSTPTSYYTPYQQQILSAYYPDFVYPPVTPVVPSNTTNNTNTCTNGSCNTNIDDHSVVNIPTTVTVNSTQQTQFCPSGMSGTYPNCYWPTVQTCPTNTFGTWPNCTYPQPTTYDICPNIAGVQPSLMPGYYIQNGNCYQNVTPIYPAPAPQPYVTLSSVPYTGLDLGPVGTTLYWGFLVLWCLFAAYLIAVKRVHSKLAGWIVGSSTSAHVAHDSHAAPAAHASAHAAPAPQFAGIDPFIASQINRAR